MQGQAGMLCPLSKLAKHGIPAGGPPQLGPAGLQAPLGAAACSLSILAQCATQRLLWSNLSIQFDPQVLQEGPHSWGLRECRPRWAQPPAPRSW